MINSIDNTRILDSLEFRIRAIEDSNNQLVTSSESEKPKKRRQFYYEVAYFVHTIWENYDLRLLFDDLLKYQSRLVQVKEYSESWNSILELISSISCDFLNHKDFKEFEETIDFGWINPFENWPTLKIRELLEKLSNLEKYKINIHPRDIFPIFLDEREGLNGIYNRFVSFTDKIPEGIPKKFESFKLLLRILSFYELFQFEYLGVKSAVYLQKLYRNMHPYYIPLGTDDKIYQKSLKSGYAMEEPENYLTHSKNIYNYFKQKLNTKFSIKSSIRRFKHYMELYYDYENSKSLEIGFQKEFDLFMFNNGYFALSQGQIGNARFDDIIINDGNAFLCEHKQIGFGKSKETVKTIISKFVSSKIQTNIYHERLRFFPSLSNDVYVLVFTSIKLRFKNNLSDIQRDGINFIFELIYLGKTVSSKIKQEEEIDIESIIQ